MAFKIPCFGRIASKEESILEGYYCYNQFFQANLIYPIQNDKGKAQGGSVNAYFGAKTPGKQAAKVDIKSDVAVDVKVENVQCVASVNEKETLAFNFILPFNKRKIAEVRGEGLYVRPGLRFKTCPLARDSLKEFTASLLFDSKCARGGIKIDSNNFNLTSYKGTKFIGADEIKSEDLGLRFNIHPLSVSGLIGITANLALENKNTRWKFKANLHNISIESSRGTEFQGFSGRIRLNPNNISICNFGFGAWLKEGIARFTIIFVKNFQGNEKSIFRCYFSQKIFENVDFVAMARIKNDKAIVIVGNEIRYNKYEIIKAKVSSSGVIGLALFSRILPHSTMNISAELNFLHPLSSKLGIKLNFRS